MRHTEGQGHVQMEAEVGIMQAKECQRFLSASRSQGRVEAILSHSLQKDLTLLIL